MAFYHRIGNFTAVAWCSLGSGLLGLFFLVIGTILSAVAYTEITPPNYDENYERYQGSNMMRIVGPLLMACGGFLLFGSCGFFAYAFWAINMEDTQNTRTMSRSGGRGQGSQVINYHQPGYDDKA
ncbi:hypothetical protein HDE_11591 [Halotydeus destructor]|nr:hypothetical protein HDE_11591 [Halotydeus destructor]